ncbi:hypothetical protein [Halapricum hydrolyticum]|uniref:Peptidase S54 rhomboid domain-containing protein n=1 Tax=Halapricum hydrolyticum TaxID=2979991 RepID=A0AAE3LFR4_9EURY|nr:hypothetical protein [Halapricum hydrolyticum]MCU4719008.1 hypothetical protein [Halapricum hydrolyticum]MCU4727937.1 hypothetical protein [Halapricum hydrolyticum]
MNSSVPSPRRWIRKGPSIADVLLLAVVPVVLVSVYTLPAGTREALVFRYADPALPTAFAAPFVHLDASHLLFNLTAYGLIVGAIYVLSRVSGRRGEFRVVFVSLLLAGPPVLSYLNLTIVRLGVTYGFSGVLMAFYGYLPLSIAEYLDSRLRIGQFRTLAPLLFFVGLLLVTIQTLRAVLDHPVTVAVDGSPASVTWVLVATLAELLVVLSLVVALYALSITDGEPIGQQLRHAVGQSGAFEFAIGTLILFLTVPFATFPADPVSGTRVVNLYVHAVGYGLGFISSYLYYVLGRTES